MTTDLRTRILDAAIKLLETEGSKAFGQTRIARAAGVKQGNITYHFPKKADLVAAVVERVNEQRIADLQDLVDRSQTMEHEKLRALVFERLPAMATEIKRSRVMLAMLVESVHDPSVGTLMSSVTDKQRATLAALIHRDPGDLDLDLVLAMLSGLSLHVLGAGRASGSGSERIDAMLRRFRQWLPTLLAPTSATAPTPAPPGASTKAPSAQTPSTRAPSAQASSTKAPSAQASSTKAPSARAPSTRTASARAPSTRRRSTPRAPSRPVRASPT